MKATNTIRNIVAVSAVTSWLFFGTAIADGHNELSEYQLQYGCWQTPPNCLKVSKPKVKKGQRRDVRGTRDRYGLLFTNAIVRVRNRCGGPVYVKMIFANEDGDKHGTSSTIWLADNEKKTIKKSSYDSYRDDNDGYDKPAITGNITYAWIGVPETETKNDSQHGSRCETEMFQDLEYDL